MGALFGALAALSIGLGDLFGRHVANRRGSVVAAMIIQGVATVASLAMLLVISSRFASRDVAIGAVSGIGLGIGLGCYLGGLTRSSSAVVAPVVATLSALIPFGYATARGADASAAAVVGAAVAIGGLVLVTAGGGQVANVGEGLRWAVVSGLGYGFGLSIVIEVSEASGAWPAVAQRAAALVLMAAIVLQTKGRLPIVGVRLTGVLAGTFAGLSTIFYLLGVQADATPAVVTASMFPAVTVAVGRVVYGDQVGRWQVVGLVVVLAGVIGVVTN